MHESADATTDDAHRLDRCYDPVALCPGVLSLDSGVWGLGSAVSRITCGRHAAPWCVIRHADYRWFFPQV